MAEPKDPMPGSDDVGAARGTGDPDDPDRAGGGPRAGASTEYARNADEEAGTDEPPGQG